MDNARRLQYLAAMGIDVWVPIPGRLSTAANADSGVGLAAADEQNSDGEVLVDECGLDGAFALPDAARSERAATGTGHFAEHETPLPEGVSNMDWKALQTTVASCQQCGLCATRTQTVFGSGNRQAQWLLIGEAPGQQEDLQGEPFVGKAGQLLTEMLRAIGLTREEVYIANVLKCRPPNNRDPKPEEMAACNAYIQRQIELVRPRIILAVGRISAQHLLQTATPVGKLRGQVHYLGDIPLLVLYHPAYLLRSLLEKRKAWEDLQMALRVFRETAATR